MTDYLVTTGGRPRYRRAHRRALALRDVLACALDGHKWGPWTCDDYEGPMELLGDDPKDEGAWMPLLSREARDGEWGHRVCDRCRLGQARWPVGQAPSRAVGVVVTDP